MIESIGKEMVSQSNRGTQGVMFMIQELRERVVNPDYDDVDHSLYRVCEKHNTEDVQPDDSGNVHEDDLPKDIQYCWDCEEICIGVDYADTTERTGIFFTEKAAQEHIDSNRYHYKKPRIYGVATWRNPEMQAVQKHLIELSGEEVPSHYE